jgi:hypothetical protein
MRTARLAIIGACIVSTAAAAMPQVQVDIPGLVPTRPPSDIRMPQIAEPKADKDVRRRSNASSERSALRAFEFDGTPVVVQPTDAVPDPSGVAALLVDGRTAAVREMPGTLLLADGQRIHGELSTKGGSAVWKSVWLPDRTITAEGVRAIVLEGDVPAAATDADVVLLRNGDRVDGIVTAVAATGATVERTGSKDAVQLPWDRIRAISFVAPAAPASGVRVWMADGSVIDSARASWMNTDFLRLGGSGPGDPPVTLPRNFVLGVRGMPGSVVPLGSIGCTASDASDAAGMRYANRPPLAEAGEWALDAAPLTVEGPVLLRYAGVPNGGRLVARVERPERVRSVGATELVLRAAGKELARQRFDATNARANWCITLPPGPFELELLAADGDPAGDLVVLEQALVIPAAAAAPAK